MNASSHESVNEPEPREPSGPLDDWLDSALEQSFPASDPVPSFRGDPAPPATGDGDDTGQRPSA